MSAIRSNYSLPRPIQVVPTSKPVTVEVADDSVRSADADMMYAWSIGVTNVGRSYEEQRSRAGKEEESCPPEVYIG